eukprot:TRINITY_DN11079_c0_g1_i1.p1 TRINITY_DN11079_c0_g1~~TRINITY_DN11079_c0_g1_i1.p1  ORF type:complete len:333 (+),score=119.32 TRINITY_DN11079_c0_g1_i1:75-1001(+)
MAPDAQLRHVPVTDAIEEMGQQPWDRRLMILGFMVLVGAVLSIVNLSPTLAYASCTLRLDTARLPLGEITLWEMDLNAASIAAAGTVDEGDLAGWKHYAMHFAAHKRTHRNLTDEIIAMKIGSLPATYHPAFHAAWGSPAARPTIAAIRAVSEFYLYHQTALAVVLSISIAGVLTVPVRAMRVCGQASLIAAGELINTITLAVSTGKMVHIMDSRFREFAPQALLGDAFEFEWEAQAVVLFVSFFVHAVAFIIGAATAICSYKEPYPRGQGPNFPSAINGPARPSHYYPIGHPKRTAQHKSVEPTAQD